MPDQDWLNTAFWPCMDRPQDFGEAQVRERLGTANLDIRFGIPACEFRTTITLGDAVTETRLSVERPLIGQQGHFDLPFGSVDFYLAVTLYSQAVARDDVSEKVLVQIGACLWGQFRLNLNGVQWVTRQIIINKTWALLVARPIGPGPVPLSCFSAEDVARFRPERIGEAEVILLAAEDNRQLPELDHPL